MEPNHHPLQAIVPTFDPFTVRSVGLIEEDMEINSTFDAVHVLGVCLRYPNLWSITDADREKVLRFLRNVAWATDRRVGIDFE